MLFVHPDMWGYGIGRLLLDRLIEELGGRRITDLQVSSESA